MLVDDKVDDCLRDAVVGGRDALVEALDARLLVDVVNTLSCRQTAAPSATNREWVLDLNL